MEANIFLRIYIPSIVNNFSEIIGVKRVRSERAKIPVPVKRTI